VHWSCYVLLFTDFVNFGQSRLNGLSLGAFILLESNVFVFYVYFSFYVCITCTAATAYQ